MDKIILVQPVMKRVKLNFFSLEKDIIDHQENNEFYFIKKDGIISILCKSVNIEMDGNKKEIKK